MLETSGRLLKLLSLLQARRHWPGTELSRRLEVTPRTIRRDVDRLRQLGYPVEALPGRDGGYRLGAGGELPPLLLDDDEALAVVLGLRTAAGSAVTGIAEHSVRALAKLERILPSRVRHRVSALGAAVVPVPWSGGPTVDPAVLIVVASACRDRDRLRFDYTDSAGLATVRTVEPHNLVAWGRRWYLVAWDLDRADWRTFRVDRISPRIPTGPRFARRDLPAPDAAAFVADRMAGVHAVEHAVLRVRGSVEAVQQWVAARWAEEVPGTDPAASGPAGSGTHLLRLSAGNREELVGYIAMLDADVEVLGPPEVIEHVRTVATRLLRAAGSPSVSGSGSPWPERAGS